MLHIQTLIVNFLEVNCYVVSDESRECVIIDCGAQSADEFAQIRQYIEKEQLHPVHLLNTHLHFDHVWGNQWVEQTYHLQTEASSNDQYLYDDVSNQIQQILQVNIPMNFHGVLARSLNEGDTVTFGSHQLQVIATPGHTPGGICFWCPEEKVLFSGDSLFRCSIGRTDLPGGNTQQLTDALSQKILTLPAETKVLPGHGPASTIQDERLYNPYLA